MNPFLLFNRLSAAFSGNARAGRRSAAALALMATTACAYAQWNDQLGNSGFEDNDQPWQESEITLPAPPQSQDLLPFYVSPIATQSFAIDAKSVTVDSDGVIRYTLVATSSSGARNVSYEGIRCATYESKRYAFGQPDGAWSRSRYGQWRTIHGYAANRPQAVLAKNYFCRELTIAGSAEDMVERIRSKHTLASQRDLQ